MYIWRRKRDIKTYYFGDGNYIRYAKYTACHMPNSKPLLSETVTLLALTEDNSPKTTDSQPSV